MLRGVVCADRVLEGPGCIVVVLIVCGWSLAGGGGGSGAEAGGRDASTSTRFAWSGDAREAACSWGDGHGGGRTSNEQTRLGEGHGQIIYGKQKKRVEES